MPLEKPESGCSGPWPRLTPKEPAMHHEQSDPPREPARPGRPAMRQKPASNSPKPAIGIRLFKV